MKPYRDYIITFQTDTRIATRAPITMRDQFSLATAAGLSVGLNAVVLYIRHHYKDYAQFNAYSDFQTGDDYYAYMYYLGREIGDLNVLNRSEIQNLRTVGYNNYVLLVHTYYWPGLKIEGYVFGTKEELADFLRGFMTMTHAFNIPLHELIFAAPFRDNTDYMINNIRLPSFD